MTINISEIKDQMLNGWQFVVEKTGELGARSVRVLMQGVGHIQRDSRLTILTIAVANILFFHIALVGAKLTSRLQTRLFGSEPTESSITRRSVAVLTSSITLMVAMNICLAKALQPNLTTFSITTISVATCASYFLFRLWLVRNQADLQAKAG